MLVPTAAILACAAALSATNDPYEYILVPALGYCGSTLPLAIAVAAVTVPLLVAWKAAGSGGAPIAAVAGLELVLLLLAACLIRLLEWRVAKHDAVTT